MKKSAKLGWARRATVLSMVAGVIALGVTFAHADALNDALLPGELPTDLGTVSIEASRRALEADIQDWSDDRARIQPRKTLACAIATLQRGVVSPAWLAGESIDRFLGKLGEYLHRTAGRDHGPATPLYTPLQELARVVPFSPAERAALARLMERQVPDLSDRIRLAIDTQSFLMRVTERLYKDRIDYHWKRTEGFLGFFRAEQEFCRAFTLWVDRDTQLISAAGRVLSLYAFLEKELAD